MSVKKSLVTNSIASPLDVQITEEPIPTAGEGQVVVEVLGASILPASGFMLQNPVPGFCFPTPSIYGCSSIGRVVSIGPDAVTVEKGQLVLVDSYLEARDDDEVGVLIGLMDGDSPKAKKLASTIGRNGNWTTHAVVPVECATPLNEKALLGTLGCEISELVYMYKFAVPYGGLCSIGLKAGETIIVAPSTGHFGGAAVEVAAAMGANVIALGRNEKVLEKLKATIPRVQTVKLSGDVDKDAEAIAAYGPADAFVDFSPTMATTSTHILSALKNLRRRGRVSLMGGPDIDITIPYKLVMMESLEIKGRWMYSRKEIRALVKMVESGLLKIGKAAGHEKAIEFKLEDYEQAMGAAYANNGWGQSVIFTP